MKKEFTSPAINAAYFISENILTASGTVDTVTNTLTGNENSTLTLGNQSKIDSANLFAFKW